MQQQQQQREDHVLQLSRAHIQSLQHQRAGVPASPSMFRGAPAGAYAEQPQRPELPFGGLPVNTTATGSQASGFGNYSTQQRAEDQVTAAGSPALGYAGAPRQGTAPSEAATSFAGFGGVAAAGSTVSPSMSAWPADQELAMALAVGGASGVLALHAGVQVSELVMLSLCRCSVGV